MNFLKAFWYFIFALAFVLSAVFLTRWISDSPQAIQNPPPPPAQPIVKPIVSCPADRLSYSTIGQNVKLIEKNTAMFAQDGRFINPQVIIAKNETKESKVACGYLFIRAGTNSKGALQSWEDVYINPNNFGGHIVTKDAISINDGAKYSEYLFSLDKIQYWPTAARKTILTADWAALLNVSPEVQFDIALNTNDKSGFIDEITIAYKCWNPATGEENTGCKLSVKSKRDVETNAPIN